MARTKIVIAEVEFGEERIQGLAQQFIELLIQSQYTLDSPDCHEQTSHSYTEIGERGNKT